MAAPADLPSLIAKARADANKTPEHYCYCKCRDTLADHILALCDALEAAREEIWRLQDVLVDHWHENPQHLSLQQFMQHTDEQHRNFMKGGEP